MGQRVRVWLGDEWGAGVVCLRINGGREGWSYRIKLDCLRKLPGTIREADVRPEDAVSRLGEIVG